MLGLCAARAFRSRDSTIATRFVASSGSARRRAPSGKPARTKQAKRSIPAVPARARTPARSPRSPFRPPSQPPAVVRGRVSPIFRLGVKSYLGEGDVDREELRPVLGLTQVID